MRVQRVGDGAAEGAGVQVDGRPVQGDLGVGQAAHAGDGARHVGSGHAGVADDDDVAGQPVAARSRSRCGEVRRAGLLLALDEQLDGDRRGVATGGGEVGAHAEQVEGDVALVVDRAAGVQLGPSGPSTTVGSNGGCSHSSSGSTGCTSWWP